MIISGHRFRRIPSQTGSCLFAVLVGITGSNITGEHRFGFSGEDKQLYFTLKSGRVYDPNDKFIDSYNQGYHLICNCNGSGFDTYTRFNQPTQFNEGFGPYNFDSFFISTTSTQIASFVQIEGENPTVSLNSGTQFWDNGFLRGTIILDNPDQRLDIFDAYVFSGTGNNQVWMSGFSNSFTGTGHFDLYTSNPILPNGYSVPIIFDTSAGLLGFNYPTLNVIDTGVQVITNASFISPFINNSGSGAFHISVFSPNIIDPMDISLTYTSGSGASFEFVNAVGIGGQGVYSGYINGTGTLIGTNITGTVTGFGSRLGNSQSELIDYATGVFLNYMPTGEVVYHYRINASGVLANHIQRAFITGSVTGTVGPGSGFYYFNQTVVGVPPVKIDHPFSGFVFTNQPFTGQLNNVVNITGFFTEELNGTIFSGGILVPEGNKTLTGIWNLYTGQLEGTLVNFKNNGWFTTDSYATPFTFTGNSGINHILASVEYNHDFFSQNIDIARLDITTSSGIKSVFITGRQR